MSVIRRLHIMRISICLICLLSGFLSYTQSDHYLTLHKFEGSYTSTVSFGSAIDISFDQAIVGAHLDSEDQSCLYIFQRENNLWKQVAGLFLDNSNFSDQSNISAAIDNNVAVVGLQWTDVDNNAAQGVAYVFEEKGTWQQVAKLIAEDGQAGDLFGSSIAISGNTIIVGAQGMNTKGDQIARGAAYIFTKQAGTWQQTAKLKASATKTFDSFGGAVAIDNNIAIVGDKLYEVNGKDAQGAAYVYEKQGNNWVHIATLIAEDAKASSSFGHSIAISGDIIVVGAEGYNYGNQVSQGAVYVFRLQDNEWGWGSEWQQVAKLIAKDGKGGDHFGSSVDISGDKIVVGAYLDDVGLDGFFQGSTYIFEKRFNGWEQFFKLTAEDGAKGDNFGNAVAISGETIIVGAHSADVNGKIDQGMVYAFSEPLLQTTEFKERIQAR